MKISYLELCGFRGYSRKLRLEFADCFTIIDGRNGIGKSTLFDAVEFALTGTIAKYGEQTASGESIADYIWWKGEGTPPSSRYVELGFVDDELQKYSIRREQLKEPETATLEALTARLCDTKLSPSAPLEQLCQNAIIRDELITTLSMDMKESDRYALLRDALGANDAEEWIQRGARLLASSKRRAEGAQHDVQSTSSELATAARRLDEQRARVIEESVIAEAADRLRSFTNSSAPLDQLVGPVREQIATLLGRAEELRDIFNSSVAVDANRRDLPGLTEAVKAARTTELDAESELKKNEFSLEIEGSESLAGEAEELVQLIALGRKLGLRDGHCPLCAAGRSHEEYSHGLEAAEALARNLNENAVRASQRETARSNAQAKVRSATQAVEQAESSKKRAVELVEAYDRRLAQLDLPARTPRDQLWDLLKRMTESVASAQRDLRIIETARGSTELERAVRLDADAKSRLAKAQERLGRTLKATAMAQALHDAARRAAGETLDLRLERVLPLMSELYRRLRPHPVWSDIEYSIRGDVRRFLKLQVGDNLNPQFLFSSGQRRATGLAFLLSINLSLVWSKWRSILLDDPVQHIDDFRAVHLAELLAQLVADGRQIICAVEDAALADLFCRRLPTNRIGHGKRVTLGIDQEGGCGVVRQVTVFPLPRNVIGNEVPTLAAGG